MVNANTVLLRKTYEFLRTEPVLYKQALNKSVACAQKVLYYNNTHRLQTLRAPSVSVIYIEDSY